MVQRFCLVSLTIADRKTSYRSIKQTVGSTSCPWTTILVLSSISSVSFLPLWKTARYRLKYCLKGPLNPKQPTNQMIISSRKADPRSRLPNIPSCPQHPFLFSNPYRHQLPCQVSYAAGPPDHVHQQGCKIPLARSHWRVNIGGGRVKLSIRSPDRVSAFPSNEIVKLTVTWLEKRQNADPLLF